MLIFLEKQSLLVPFGQNMAGKKRVPFRDPFFFTVARAQDLEESRMGSQLEVQIGSIGQPRRWVRKNIRGNPLPSWET